MGKISNRSAVEIIPLNQASKQIGRSHNNRLNILAHQHRFKMSSRPYMSDPTLVPRVQKYLESNVDKTYVDINVMADDLQRAYREYARLKRNPFRASVKKAYSIVLQSYGLEDQENTSGSDDDDVSDDSSPEASGFDNSMSSQLINLYSRPVLPKRIDENELIDISSDDSEDGTNDKSSNGPSTSRRANDTVINNLNKDAGAKKSANSAGGKSAGYDRGKKRKFEGAELIPFVSSPKKKKSLATLQEPSVTFKDLGGMDDVLIQLRTLLKRMIHPNLYKKYNASKPKGILLHGPPGCGKTLLANAIAGQLKIPLLEVTATELVSGISGESEERIRELFERAACSSPCILFIDKVDAITSDRKFAHKDMEKRIVTQLIGCLDALRKNPNADRVMVIGATDRLDSIDPALRRAGRFDREICIGMPNTNAREQILKALTADKPLVKEFDFKALAKLTPGFVGSDFVDLVDEAIEHSVARLTAPIYEQHKLVKAIAARNAEKEREKRQEKKKKEAELKAATAAAAAVAAAAQSSVTIDLNKSDPEIVVDDDLPKLDVQGSGGDDGGAPDGAIVVIDDEPNKQPSGSSVGAGEPVATSSPASSTPANATGGGVGSTPAEGGVANGQIPKDSGDDVGNSSDSDLEVEVQEPMALDFIKPTTISEDVCQDFDDPPVLNDDQLRSMATTITMDDFVNALKVVQPSAKREGFATVPNVTWNDVGSLSNIRQELQRCILIPAQCPEEYETLGLTTPAGILMCGPPGCGKTLIAKAMANEAGINFISVKGPELFNMYVGESERAVRMCFQRAKNSAPCIIFFDEIEAFLPKRSDSGEGGVSNRVVNQMLTEMDGVEDRKGVYLLAATNRPDIIDPAVLRPGRFDKILYVGIPSPSDRVDILQTITKNGTKPPVAPDVDFEIIGNSDELRGFTGADLQSLVKGSADVAMQEFVMRGKPPGGVIVTNDHFKIALTKIRPSVSEKDQKHYEKIKQIYTDVPNHSEVEKMELS